MVEARGRGGAGRRSGPSHGFSTEAVAESALEHGLSLQVVIELQRSVGRLEGEVDKLPKQMKREVDKLSEQMEREVDRLSRQIARQQRTIAWMTRVMFIAVGALLILGPMAAWILNNRFDRILNMLAKGG